MAVKHCDRGDRAQGLMPQSVGQSSWVGPTKRPSNVARQRTRGNPESDGGDAFMWRRLRRSGPATGAVFHPCARVSGRLDGRACGHPTSVQSRPGLPPRHMNPVPHLHLSHVGETSVSRCIRSDNTVSDQIRDGANTVDGRCRFGWTNCLWCGILQNSSLVASQWYSHCISVPRLGHRWDTV